MNSDMAPRRYGIECHIGLTYERHLPSYALEQKDLLDKLGQTHVHENVPLHEDTHPIRIFVPAPEGVALTKKHSQGPRILVLIRFS